MNQNRIIARFATAYSAMVTANAERNEDSRRVWMDVYVDAADQLGLQDSDHHGLKECRDEKRRRDDDFMANYRKAL